VALNMMATEIPDMIITDLLMPEMDGLSFIRNVKSDARYRAIPIIVLTADASEESSQAGKEAGADLLLTKPFDDDYLMDSIFRMLTNE
jgi:CheY-like chemotaxis protein